MPQAGNRARKIVQRAQWWDSTLECRPVPSARPKVARLPVVFCSPPPVLTRPVAHAAIAKNRHRAKAAPVHVFSHGGGAAVSEVFGKRPPHQSQR